MKKVRKQEDKVIPQVILTKCKVESSTSPDFSFDVSAESTSPLIVELDEPHIKRELITDDNPELHSCIFCDFTVTCGDQLHEHITNQHSESIESDIPIPTLLFINLTCLKIPLPHQIRVKRH